MSNAFYGIGPGGAGLCAGVNRLEVFYQPKEKHSIALDRVAPAFSLRKLRQDKLPSPRSSIATLWIRGEGAGFSDHCRLLSTSMKKYR